MTEIPASARDAGHKTATSMGLTDEQACTCIAGLCDCLQRNEPYNAMAAALVYVDLTNYFRLTAVVLCATRENASLEPSDD